MWGCCRPLQPLILINSRSRRRSFRRQEVSMYTVVQCSLQCSVAKTWTCCFLWDSDRLSAQYMACLVFTVAMIRFIVWLNSCLSYSYNNTHVQSILQAGENSRSYVEQKMSAAGCGSPVSCSYVVEMKWWRRPRWCSVSLSALSSRPPPAFWPAELGPVSRRSGLQISSGSVKGIVLTKYTYIVEKIFKYFSH